MKKKCLLFIMFIVLCLLITGCAGESNENVDVKDNEINEVIDEPKDDVNVKTNEGELLAPVMEWWELYNPNGFDTVTALISNPNNVAIDVSYDLVYYKDGKEVARNEMFSNYGILAGQKDVIWANYDIPKSVDVDDVKMENVYVSESTIAPINGTIELDGIGTNCELYFLPIFDSTPSSIKAWFVFYDDVNNNDKLDKGEFAFVGDGNYIVEDRWMCVEPLAHYTDFDIYFTAY